MQERLLPGVVNRRCCRHGHQVTSALGEVVVPRDGEINEIDRGDGQQGEREVFEGTFQGGCLRPGGKSRVVAPTLPVPG